MFPDAIVLEKETLELRAMTDAETKHDEQSFSHFSCTRNHQNTCINYSVRKGRLRTQDFVSQNSLCKVGNSSRKLNLSGFLLPVAPETGFPTFATSRLENIATPEYYSEAF